MEAVATYTITDILSEANTISRNFILNFARDGITIEPSKRVKIAWVERFGIAFENIQTIIEQRKTNPKMDYSLVLLLRGTLLDTHIVYYLASIYYDESLSEQERFDKIELEFERFYINQLHHQFTDLKNIKDKVPELYSQMLIHILNAYRFCFKDDTDFESLKQTHDHEAIVSSLKHKKRDFPQFWELFERIKRIEIMDRIGYGVAYAYYSHFSKIEHFGVLTHERTLSITTNDMIWDSVKYCLVGLQYVISLTDRNLPQMTEIAKLNALVVSSPNFHPQF